MGIVCDQEIVQLIGTEEEYMKKITASLEECHTLNIYAQNQALKYKFLFFSIFKVVAFNVPFNFRYLANKRKQKRFTVVKSSVTDEMKDVLSSNILSHVPVSLIF